MRTDDLIDILATNVGPVRPGVLRNTLVIAIAAGVLTAFGLMLALFGAPSVAAGGPYLGVRLLTLGLLLTLAGTGSSFLMSASRPGEPSRAPVVVIGLLLAGILSASMIALGRASPAAWHQMLLGPPWALCLICIPVFALAPFAALIWALRRAAPTHSIRTGAMVGLVAAAWGAAVFACCQAGAPMPFVVLWYGGVILLCTVVGAVLGPVLLRW